jgi:hypothetical protein
VQLLSNDQTNSTFQGGFYLTPATGDIGCFTAGLNCFFDRTTSPHTIQEPKNSGGTIVKNIVLAAALIAALIPVAAAQNVKVNGQPMHATITGQVGHRTAANVRTPGLTTIFTDLGGSTNAYDSTDGWLILGPSSAFGESQWIGFPFTPSSAATATQIKAGVAYFESGFNGIQVSIRADNSGVPGTVLRQKAVLGMANYGDPCCDALKTIPIKGTKLAANTQYWVVFGTNGGTNQSTSEGAWFFATGDPDGDQAYSFDEGSTWATEEVEESAFGVFGN